MSAKTGRRKSPSNYGRHGRLHNVRGINPMLAELHRIAAATQRADKEAKKK